MRAPVLASGAGFCLAACAGPLSTLDPAGPAAERIALIWWVMLAGATVIFAFVMALAIYAFKQERRGRDIPDRTILWGGGLVFPIVVLVALLVYGLRDGEALLPLPTGEPVYTVQAIGRQWEWVFVHPDGSIRINEMHIPAGQPVNVIVRSEDVIHSFWVPRLAGKIDAIPGRETVMRLRADRPGAYPGQCAEFCGLLHADMFFTLYAHAPEAVSTALAQDGAGGAP